MKFWNGQPMRTHYSSDSYDLECSLKGYLKSLGEYYYPKKKKPKNNNPQEGKEE